MQASESCEQCLIANKNKTAHCMRRFFADILLTPLEATRIRLVSQRGYATGLVTGFARMAREEGLAGFYAGFLPILCKYVVAPVQARLPHF